MRFPRFARPSQMSPDCDLSVKQLAAGAPDKNGSGIPGFALR